MRWPANFQVWNRTVNQRDLLTYSALLQERGLDWFLTFNTFFFINSSCRGPFIPVYEERNWVDIFNGMLNASNLVGPIAEFPPNLMGQERTHIPFVHTYMFACDKNGFNVISDTLINGSKDPIVLEREVGRNCLVRGLKVKSLMSRMRNYDLSDSRVWPLLRPSATNTCVEIPGNYFGIDIHPYEVIFIKNIRAVNKYREEEKAGISNVLAKQIELYTKWLNK